MAGKETNASRQKIIGGKLRLRPIIGALTGGDLESTAEGVGFFFPMHAFGLPGPVREFLSRARFSAAKYCFALVVRGGAPSGVPKQLNRLLKRQDLELAAFAYATTVNIFGIVSRFPVPPEVALERKRFRADVAAFARIIRDRQPNINLGYRNPILERPVFPLMGGVTRYCRLEDAFHADANCTGCGDCAAMCPANKIRMHGGSPSWNKSVACLFCLACVHRCPERAVQIRGTASVGAARMPCPAVENVEIAAQKRQLSL
jgi:ferredoxin